MTMGRVSQSNHTVKIVCRMNVQATRVEVEDARMWTELVFESSTCRDFETAELKDVR